jgi:hypothetical protein
VKAHQKLLQPGTTAKQALGQGNVAFTVMEQNHELALQTPWSESAAQLSDGKRLFRRDRGIHSRALEGVDWLGTSANHRASLEGASQIEQPFQSFRFGEQRAHPDRA